METEDSPSYWRLDSGAFATLFRRLGIRCQYSNRYWEDETGKFLTEKMVVLPHLPSSVFCHVPFLIALG